MAKDEERMITVSKQEWEELRARVLDAEEHRKGLLQHAHNLEEMLQKKEENIANFLTHLGNLEHLLREKDSDLSQHRTKLNELEARCYRYEQMLQDYGHESD